MDSETFVVETGPRRGVHDITAHIRRFASGRGDGLLSVFVPHSTAGLAIIEIGSGSDRDLLDVIDDVVPRRDGYRHAHGAPGHGADHVVPAFISPSVTIPVIAGRPRLGTWQSLALVDPNEDNRRRTVEMVFLPG